MTQSTPTTPTIELSENPIPDLGISTDVGTQGTREVAEFMASILHGLVSLTVHLKFTRFQDSLVQQFLLTLFASVLGTIWEILFVLYWTRLRHRYPSLNLPSLIAPFTRPPRSASGH